MNAYSTHINSLMADFRDCYVSLLTSEFDAELLLQFTDWYINKWIFVTCIDLNYLLLFNSWWRYSAEKCALTVIMLLLLCWICLGMSASGSSGALNWRRTAQLCLPFVHRVTSQTRRSCFYRIFRIASSQPYCFNHDYCLLI